MKNILFKFTFIILVLILFCTLGGLSYAYDPPLGLSWGISQDSVKSLGYALKDAKIKDIFIYRWYDKDALKIIEKDSSIQVYKIEVVFNEKERVLYLFFQDRLFRFMMIDYEPYNILDDVSIAQARLSTSYEMQKVAELLGIKYGAPTDTTCYQRVNKDISTFDELVWKDTTEFKIGTFYTVKVGFGYRCHIYVWYGDIDLFEKIYHNALGGSGKSSEF